MRSDGPVLLAIVFLGTALGVLIGFGVGHTGFNASYPFTDSVLHVDLTTTGPGVVGSVVLGAIGAVCLVWAFFAAIIGLFSGSGVTRHERVVERVSVVPRNEVITSDGRTTYVEDEVPVRRRHFWSRTSQRTGV
jgi:hypothetical protein